MPLLIDCVGFDVKLVRARLWAFYQYAGELSLFLESFIFTSLTLSDLLSLPLEYFAKILLFDAEKSANFSASFFYCFF